MDNTLWINHILTGEPITRVFATKVNQVLTLQLYIQPGSAKTEIIGLHGTRLKIKVAAPPTDDKANKELCVFLALEFNVPKSNVYLSKGLHSRNKTVEIILAL